MKRFLGIFLLGVLGTATAQTVIVKCQAALKAVGMRRNLDLLRALDETAQRACR